MDHAPERSPSLQNYPGSDEEVKALATEMWGNIDGKTIQSAKFGKGLIMNGLDLKTALDKVGVLPDVSVPENTPLLWMHRRLNDVEIYFITNQSDSILSMDAGFRVEGMQPELWDAVTGTMRDLPAFTQEGAITKDSPYTGSQWQCFYCFQKKRDACLLIKWKTIIRLASSTVEITSPWQVIFDAAQRGPDKPVTMTTLEDWSKSKDDKIRYYAGSAVYLNKVVLAAVPGRRNSIPRPGKGGYHG